MVWAERRNLYHEGDTAETMCTVHVWNQSDMPVFFVNASLRQASGMPGATYGMNDALMPGSSEHLKLDYEREPGFYAPDRVYVLFQDAAGNWWHRYADGRLILNTPAPSP